MSTSNDDAGAHRLCGPDPLFPPDAVPEHQRIRAVTFCLWRADGRFARLESFDADKMRSWNDASRVLCAGLYRAVGMDEQERHVAAYPPHERGWVAILPGVEPSVVPDWMVMFQEPPAGAAPTLDPTMRAWVEADTERLRAQTELIRRQCAWMDAQAQALGAQAQGQIVIRPGGKPN